MSDKEDGYCRLCAEPTSFNQLISSEGDVGVNSKIATKMQWINVDISSDLLPMTICFSCFDLLERTWSFLNNVRTAQEKLYSIFSKKENTPQNCEIKPESSDADNAGQPVNTDWEDFQSPKPEVKDESPIDNLQVITVDPNTLIDVDYNIVKTENAYSDIDFNNDGFDSTDSDLPLGLAVKKKKLKKKRRTITEIQETDDSLNVKPLTWDDYMCRCASCDAQCKNLTSLRLHSIQIHSCCCAFKCSDCSKVIHNFRMFVNHVRMHNKLLRYCCEICNKRFTRSAYMKKHCSLVHKDTYVTTCINCGLVFDTQEQMQEHLLVYAKGIKKRAIKRENLDTDLKCQHCNKEFKSKSNLQQHKLVHTNRSRDFSCHVCGKMFFTKGTLSTHMTTHEDTKPFKCDICSMAFRARGNLQSHISLHSGAKPFVCEQCGKSFRVKRHLKSHSIVHTDLMPYVCEYCNKQFRFKTRLNLHLRQHTGAKPYTCIYCQRDFTNGSNFKKHMKRRHNIDTSKKRIHVDTKNIKRSDDVSQSQS
ncbi:unnamed protein product [Chilo suppressalis]|uniref:Uncharacterized protein n=1 Tax=Chilo suppressalis TaxID=168631 RepID=A0ABN8B4X9_CHISP|nr:unnamed protein product [Chilo suppressalis]